MARIHLGKDILGILSCGAFIISAAIFWHAAKHGFYMYPNLDLAFGGTALLGIVFAIAGIFIGIWRKGVPLFSIVGGILNLVPAVFMYGILALATMH